MPVINRKGKNDKRNDNQSSNTGGRSYLEVIKGLEKEMGSMRGRDADVVMRECCLLYTSPSPRDEKVSRMPSSA